MAFIRTLLGDIQPEDLGVTYSHEHIVCSPPYFVEKGQNDLLLDDPEKSFQEVELFRAAGGNSIVDATVMDYGRRVSDVVDISKRSGIHIIGTTGFNKDTIWPAKIPGKNITFAEWIDSMSIHQLCDYLVNEVEKGLDNTSHRAGVIKYGTSYNRISLNEEKIMCATVQAQRITHAPVYTHLESGTMALEQITILKREGFDLQNIVFGHMDLNPDPYIHEKVVQTGAYICFDGIGKIKYHPESLVLDLIFNLVEKGYQKQILVSGDTARKSYYHSYDRALGLPYILKTWRPRIIEEAHRRRLDGEQLAEDLFIHNPMNCFSFKC